MSRGSAVSTRRNATDIAKQRMCVGCGACVYVCPENKLELADIVEEGLRPVITPGVCGGCSDCIQVCPGLGINHVAVDSKKASESVTELAGSWGPVLEVWEGFAGDEAIRFLGSSGGLASALALYCIERRGMKGLVHVGSDESTRYRNQTIFSTSKEQILAATGSRYSPASPCERLDLIERATGECVFIGKPCDVEGLRKAQGMRPELAKNVGVAIGIFCAGTPSTKGTLDLLRHHGVNPAKVEELRYRGRGWPGSFAVRLRGDSSWRKLATYADAWGFLQRYRPYRCYLCPDGTSEFADISCGDPWYRDIPRDEPGISLVLVRTERGRELVRAAIDAGYVKLAVVRPDTLGRSQRELQLKRGAIWGRLLTMRALGVATPRFGGFSLLNNWLQIPGRHKLRSVLGTVRRVITRHYHRPYQYAHLEHSAESSRRRS